MKVSVSFLKTNDNLTQTIKKIEQTDCDYIHVDVEDGIFVPNKTGVIQSNLHNSLKKLDVHLMCAHPSNFIDIYKDLNTEYITIQAEIKEDLNLLINKIKFYNIKVGIALNPDTSIKEIEPYLNLIDQVLVLSVHPGKGGQEFIKDVIPKIEELIKLRNKNNYHYIINVDGGINDKTINYLKDKQVDMVVSGSFVCLAQNYQQQINKLR